MNVKRKILIRVPPDLLFDQSALNFKYVRFLKIRDFATIDICIYGQTKYTEKINGARLQQPQVHAPAPDCDLFVYENTEIKDSGFIITEHIATSFAKYMASDEILRLLCDAILILCNEGIGNNNEKNNYNFQTLRVTLFINHYIAQRTRVSVNNVPCSLVRLSLSLSLSQTLGI